MSASQSAAIPGDLRIAGTLAPLLGRPSQRHGGTRAAPGIPGLAAPVAGRAGLVALLLVAMLRTAAFMGYLSYLAAFYDARFDLAPGPFALVWTLSGASFFLSNPLTGRLAVAARRAERVLPTALLAASHSAAAACVITLLVERSGPVRGAALGLNAAAMHLGTFFGAAADGVGLGVGSRSRCSTRTTRASSPAGPAWTRWRRCPASRSGIRPRASAT